MTRSSNWADRVYPALIVLLLFAAQAGGAGPLANAAGGDSIGRPAAPPAPAVIAGIASGAGWLLGARSWSDRATGGLGSATPAPLHIATPLDSSRDALSIGPARVRPVPPLSERLPYRATAPPKT